ncbi:MAG: nucleoside triphosphate pyrophosphatase [Verrucomicrobiia bacterium]
MADEEMWILASSSPRRHALLREAGIAFTAVAPEVEEWDNRSHPELSPQELVLANARRKGMAVWRGGEPRPILAADTLVVCEGRVMGKPANLEEAAEMLRWLSGRTHEVITGVVCVRGKEIRETVVRTRVTFRTLDEAGIGDYLARVHVLDKAGGYALQEEGARIIERIEGSRSNVVGLPMEKVLNWWRQGSG